MILMYCFCTIDRYASQSCVSLVYIAFCILLDKIFLQRAKLHLESDWLRSQTGLPTTHRFYWTCILHFLWIFVDFTVFMHHSIPWHKQHQKIVQVTIFLKDVVTWWLGMKHMIYIFPSLIKFNRVTKHLITERIGKKSIFMSARKILSYWLRQWEHYPYLRQTLNKSFGASFFFCDSWILNTYE